MNAVERPENSSNTDNLSGNLGGGPFSKSSMAAIKQALAQGPTSVHYASALSEYRLRQLRLLRLISDNQRHTTLSVERFAEHAGKSIRRIHRLLKILVWVVATGIAIAAAALIRFW